MTDKEVIRRALIHGASELESILDAYAHLSGAEDEAFKAETRALLKRMREVHLRYFGPRPDPFKNATLVTLEELRKQRDPA